MLNSFPLRVCLRFDPPGQGNPVVAFTGTWLSVQKADTWWVRTSQTQSGLLATQNIPNPNRTPDDSEHPIPEDTLTVEKKHEAGTPTS